MSSIIDTMAVAPTEGGPRRHLLARFWQSARGYWSPGGPRIAWIVTISLVAVVFVSLGVTYALNLWNRHFFDALEARNGAGATEQALLFPALVAAYLAVCVFGMWGRMTMQRTWRAWLNDHLLKRWLARGRFYTLELVGGDHKNPEHRINDDLRIATDMPVDFVTGFLTSVLSAVTFIAVLWTVGGSITVTVSGTPLVIPGFLVLAAVAYALVANGAMLAIARRFIPVTEAKNQAEAEYRYRLTRVRENAESIALLGGAAAERRHLDASFGEVFARWRDLMAQHMRAVIVSQASAQLCGVIPVLLCTPRYLDGSMTLGQVMQVASAFTIVQGALSWFMDNYTRLADWTASARRVASLMVALDRLDEGRPEPAIARRRGVPGAVQLRDVSVVLADGRPILRHAHAAIKPGEKVLVAGESGSGKSSLVRAIAGCWPWGSGEIVCSERVLVIPQRPYVPEGTLRRAVTYPLESVASDKVSHALAAVGLGGLVPQLDVAAPWHRTLSEGEKQRLAMARVLLHRPDVVVLDEATSALHVAGQAELMGVLARALPGATVISIGHRPELEAFHDRRLTVAHRSDGATIAQDSPIGSRAGPVSSPPLVPAGPARSRGKPPLRLV